MFIFKGIIFNVPPRATIKLESDIDYRMQLECTKRSGNCDVHCRACICGNEDAFLAWEKTGKPESDG